MASPAFVSAAPAPRPSGSRVQATPRVELSCPFEPPRSHRSIKRGLSSALSTSFLGREVCSRVQFTGSKPQHVLGTRATLSDPKQKQSAKLAGKELDDFLHKFDESKKLDLFLMQREIDADGAEPIAQMLAARIAESGDSGCKSINLTINELGDRGASVLCNVLSDDTKIDLLVLSHNRIGAGAVESIERLLSRNCSLDALDLAYNNLGNAGAAAAYRAMIHSGSPLRVLVLSGNGVDTDGAVLMADAIRTMAPDTQIADRPGVDFRMASGTELFLNRNKITGAGVEAMVDALMASPVGQQLTLIALADNPIGDQGLRALSRLQIDKKRMYRLDLDNTQVGDDGAFALAEAFAQTSSITRTYLCGNHIGDPGVIALAEALMDNETMSRLDLKSNDISDEGAFALARTIEKTRGLTVVELNNNRITKAGAEAIVAAAKKNTRVSVIGVKKLLA